MESTPRIHLIGGANFSPWPDLKWARGNTHARALEASFVEWSAGASVTVEGVLREDRQGIDLVARVPRGIPTQQWALMLGDALHNLRSAFDAFAWGIAHFDGRQPSKPKAVQFPVCVDEKQWIDATNAWVGELDPQFKDRIKLIQPFTFAEPGVTSVLKMIHDLDIEDKHKEFVTVSADLNGFAFDGVYFDYEDHAADATPRLDMRTGVKFADGVVLGTLHAGASIKALGPMILRPSISVQLTWEGQTFDVRTILPIFVSETRGCLDMMMHGLGTVEADDDGWQPLETGAPSEA